MRLPFSVRRLNRLVHLLEMGEHKSANLSVDFFVQHLCYILHYKLRGMHHQGQVRLQPNLRVLSVITKHLSPQSFLRYRAEGEASDGFYGNHGNIEIISTLWAFHKLDWFGSHAPSVADSLKAYNEVINRIRSSIAVFWELLLKKVYCIYYLSVLRRNSQYGKSKLFLRNCRRLCENCQNEILCKKLFIHHSVVSLDG